jgi:hypothetical protein
MLAKMIRTGSSLVLITVLGACSTTPAAEYTPPPISITNSQGTVRAFSLEDCQRIGRLLEELNPGVQEVLGTSSSAPLQVFLLDRKLPNHAAGCIDEGRILMGLDMRKTERFVLAHELVHWNAIGIWKHLTPVEMEGLADVIALDLAPKAQDSMMVKLDHIYALQSGAVRDPRDALDSRENLVSSQLPPDRDASVRAIGYFAIAQVGVSGLRSLCTEAGRRGQEFVSADSLLEQAQLPIDDASKWSVSVTITLDPGTTSITFHTSPARGVP